VNGICNIRRITRYAYRTSSCYLCLPIILVNSLGIPLETLCLRLMPGCRIMQGAAERTPPI